MIPITFKYRYRKQILIVSLIIILIGGVTGLSIYKYLKSNKKEPKEEIVITKKNSLEKKKVEQIEKYKVDIKGEVINPGIYSLEKDKRVIDQTTPNMIQRISGTFERNPLISKEI